MAKEPGPWARNWQDHITPGRPELDAHPTWQPGDPDLAGPGPRGSWIRFQGVPTSETNTTTVDVLIGTDWEGRLAMYGLATSVPLTQAVYQSLPIDALKKAAANAINAETRPEWKRIPKKDRSKPETLAYIAQLSRHALTRTEAAQAVADAIGCTSITTAKTWIAKAEEAGHDVGTRRKEQ